MLPNVGMGELVIILLVVLLLFGSKRLPEVAKGLGRSVKSFKDGLRESLEEPSPTATEARLEAKEEKKTFPS